MISKVLSITTSGQIIPVKSSDLAKFLAEKRRFGPKRYQNTSIHNADEKFIL